MMNFLNRAWLLLRSIVRSIMHGGFRRTSQRIHRVLVFQSSKLGDMVCTTPVFRALKSSGNDITVTVMGSAVNRDLLYGHPDIDSYIVWDKSNVSRMIQEVRSGNFDVGIMVSQNFTAMATLVLAGVPFVTSLHVYDAKSPNETFAYRLLSRFIRIVAISNYKYIPREYLKLLEPLGIEVDDTKKTLTVDGDAKEKVRVLIGKAVRLRVGIIPSAGNRIKEWPPERFAEVADYLLSHKMTELFLLGGPNDELLCEKIISFMKNKTGIRNLGGRLDINMLKAMISELDLVIGADTGPIHIAHALGIATIDIAGAVDERVIPPRGPRNIVIVPERKKAELFVMTARVYDFQEVRRQMEGVSVGMVINAIEGVMKKL